MQLHALHQEIFDIVAVHLLTQNKRAVAVNGSSCMYRTETGLKCAIGCLIPDEKYSPAFEGSSISLLGAKALLPEKYKDTPLIYLISLQRLHDGCPVNRWRTELKNFAEQISLSPAVVLNFTEE